jgi:hypothetical protein
MQIVCEKQLLHDSMSTSTMKICYNDIDLLQEDQLYWQFNNMLPYMWCM